MHTDSAAPSDDHLVWQWIVARLHADIEVLADDFMHELGRRGTYHHGLVTQDELRSAARDSFRALIDILGQAEGAGPSPEPPGGGQARRPEDTLAVAQALGRRRARAQVPVDSLIEAVRLDFVVLWRRIREHAPPDRPQLLVDHTEHVLSAVETYIGEVQRSFLAETARIQQDAQIATERLVHLLLDEGPVDDETLDRLSGGLGIPADATFEAVVSQAETAMDLQDTLAPLLHRGEAWGHRRHRFFCAFRAAPALGPPLTEMVPGIGCLSLPQLQGLAAVRRAVRGAERLMPTLPALDGPQSLHGLWEFGAAAYFRDLAPDFLDPYLEGLRRLTPAERSATVHAVRSYMDRGSIKLTAEQLFCHRNTVVNRLRAFRDATGLDVAVPRHASLAQIVLAAGVDREPDGT